VPAALDLLQYGVFLMRAVMVDPSAPAKLAIGDLPEPTADRSEAIVGVRAFSINRGEVRRAENLAAGTPIGWDIAGVIEATAADGSGPPVGTRVVGFSRAMQGWAERVAVPTRDLAEIPDGVSDENAATLPVAGLTALYALERCDRLLANRVLVTGAAGGVGYFACQLAREMGADVVGQIRRAEHRALVEGLGIKAIVSKDGEGLDGPFRAVVDGVGGELLSRALEALDSGSQAIVYGVSAAPTSLLPARQMMMTGDARVEGFHLYHETQATPATDGLERLLRLVGENRLKTLVSIDEDWSKVGSIATQLIDRSYPGKAICRVA
jgi:NADPH:quinone reductase-like Zn-dependent oxidoreductase